MSLIYLDSCAVVKLVRIESESAHLKTWLRANGGLSNAITCDLTHTEVRRALHRIGVDEAQFAAAVKLLNAAVKLPLKTEIMLAAGDLAPATSLRSLDAIHVAAAQALGPACRYFVTYDKRLAKAATAQGLAVAAPGQ